MASSCSPRGSAALFTEILHPHGALTRTGGQDTTNIIDPNAISILHMDERTKCGHLKKELAAKLAPLLDEGKITLLPFIAEGD